MTFEADRLATVLPGTWHVLATTFPMWLSGRRLDPTFTYSRLGKNPLVLRDEVRYRTRTGAHRGIHGTDTFDPHAGRFTWRGRLLLSMITSRWRVVWISADQNTVVLTFDRSLVTPAGMDVIGRDAEAPASVRERMAQQLAEPDRPAFRQLRWLTATTTPGRTDDC
ncbi:hypothetical protein [Micromonospora sp. LOL_024]|uniref:hypothetical protein n=1 Tax=Micromonospora sp. LOL_024 TaxID=3345412 RepID=UPI003A8686D7